MTFWEHFLRLLPKRPLPALAALYWYLTRRRVRARNRLRGASADLPFTYLVWIETKEREAAPDEDFATEISSWVYRPRFSILLIYEPGSNAREDLDRSIRSVEGQAYPALERLDVTTATRLKEQVVSAMGDFLVPLRVGNALSEMSLFRFAQALQAQAATILYGDEDELDNRGWRTRPWFKPRWNSEMFLAQDYLSSAVAIDARLARTALATGGQRDLDELLLEATALAGDSIVHVPHVLGHVSQRIGGSSRRVEAVGQHLQPLGARATRGPFDTVKVEWPLPPELPLVTLIVPTKDKVSLLRPCLESVLARTDYQNFEILIVDNGSVEHQTAKYLAAVGEDPRVRVVEYMKPYNFSAINNFAAGEARGSFLCLLNNDTEVIEQGWLTEMMRYAVRPEVGAVGAKLLYEDGSIQHAGVVVGIGEAAGHAHRFLPANQPGYFRMPHVAQFVTAVTAACLVVEKSKFVAAGGLDEDNLAVAFNDVDFCLKLQARGWRNVYVPHAVLFHHESKSRGNDMSPLNIDRYRAELKTLQERWGTKVYEDPLHNPNLDRYSETFVFRL